MHHKNYVHRKARIIWDGESAYLILVCLVLKTTGERVPTSKYVVIGWWRRLNSDLTLEHVPANNRESSSVESLLFPFLNPVLT